MIDTIGVEGRFSEDIFDLNVGSKLWNLKNTNCKNPGVDSAPNWKAVPLANWYFYNFK